MPATNAARLLERYRDRLCTFNDDIQGTAAVTTATLLAAVNATGVPLSQQTIAMFGAGSAGIGIIDLLIAAMKEEGLSEEQAREPHLCIQSLRTAGRRRARHQGKPAAAGAQARGHRRMDSSTGGEDMSLLDVVRNAKVTVLVGVSAQAGAFTEEIVREMARHTRQADHLSARRIRPRRPRPLPADLLRWTDGRALVGTGSPFPPVEIDGRLVRISQVNNSFIFPGLALGHSCVAERGA